MRTGRVIASILSRGFAPINAIRHVPLYGIGRDDVEYILSTFKGIHDRQPLLPEASSTAQRILEKHDEISPPG